MRGRKKTSDHLSSVFTFLWLHKYCDKFQQSARVNLFRTRNKSVGITCFICYIDAHTKANMEKYREPRCLLSRDLPKRKKNEDNNYFHLYILPGNSTDLAFQLKLKKKLQIQLILILNFSFTHVVILLSLLL